MHTLQMLDFLPRQIDTAEDVEPLLPILRTWAVIFGNDMQQVGLLATAYGFD